MSRSLPSRWGAAFGYALLGLPLGALSFAVLVALFSVGAGLFVTYLGLAILVGLVVVARWFGELNRQLANTLLDARIEAPAPLHKRPGRLGTARGYLLDAPSWRAFCYGLLKLPLGVLSFTVAVSFVGYGLGGLTYWYWRPFLPCQNDRGVCHRGAQWAPHYFLDTTPRIVMAAVLGLVVLALAPLAVGATVRLDRAVARGLLGGRIDSAGDPIRA